VRIGTKIGKTFVSYGKSGVYISRWIGGIRVSHFEAKKKGRHKPEKVEEDILQKVERYKKENLGKQALYWFVGIVVVLLLI